MSSRSSSSLYVGPFSELAGDRDIEHHFGRFGACKIEKKNRFAVITYEDSRNAESAVGDLQKKYGSEMIVEWVKGKSHKSAYTDERCFK